MRHTGIPIIGDVPWGTHFCQFYQDKQDLVDILVPYFKTGLANNEFCMWVTSEPLRADEAKAALAHEIGDLEPCFASGQLEIIDYSQWYTLGGRFESDRVLHGWVDRLETARERGFDGLRLTGNTFWLEKSDWDSFTEYEATVDSVIGRYRMLAICTYSLAKCGAIEIMDVVSNHAFALIKRAGKWQTIENAERKKTEMALRESEERFRALVMASSDVVYSMSPDWSEMHHLRGQDFIADTEEPCRTWLQKYIHPQDQVHAMAAINEAIRTKSVFQLAHRVLRVDGSLGWTFSRAIPIQDANGEIIEWFGTARDITQRKQAEEALLESRADLDRAQAVAQIGSWRLDTRRDILAWSDENHRIFGVPKGTPLSYETFLEMVHPDDRQYVDTQWKAGLRGEPYDIEHRILVNGQVKWVREKAYLEFDQGGSLLGGFGITQDITERKLAEETLKWTAGVNELLSEIASHLLHPGDLQQQVEEICRRAMAFLDCHTFFNFLVDEQAGRLHLNACAGVSEQAACDMEWLDYGSAVCGCAARDRERIVAEDIQSTADPRTELVKSFGVQAYCAHPLLVQGRLIGTLSFGTRSRTRFAAREIEVMAAVADLVTTAMNRIATERALRESEERLRLAQQAAGVGTFEWNLRTGVNTWTPELEQMYGLEPGSFARTQPGWESLVHPEDRAAALRRVEQAFDTGLPTDGEWRVTWPDGSIHWINGRWQVSKDAHGTPVRMTGVNVDITERKHAEEKIRHHIRIIEGINRILSETMAVETEEESGRKCLAIAEQVTESKFGFIAELNADGLLESVAMSDPGWEACRIETSAVARRLPMRFDVHGIYGRVILDSASLIANDPTSHPDSIGIPQGHPPLTAFLGVPLKHESKTIGMMAVGNREGGYHPQDQERLEALAVAVVQVLMRKRAERAVRETEDHLRQAQKMESIGVLAGGIAHDFNNLLTSILGNASLLQMDGAAGDGQQLTSIIESSEKAAALTRQLLAYAGKGEFQISDFDVSQLVRSLGVLLRVSIPKNVEVKLDVPRTLPAVRGDSSQIQQVIMNLVINAAEATEGRSDGLVSVGARVLDLGTVAAERVRGGLSPGRYVCIAVKDNGCGMDQETKAKIFEPFFTTKFTGRGLGLAAVDGILRSHRGAITVESVPGKGSQFTVYLPASGARVRGPEGTDEAFKSVRALTVLVVDDEEPVRGFTRTALERLGYEVLLASNGKEALDLLNNRGDVDLVLLDIVMPVVGGIEAFREMQAKRPDLAVLIASGYSRQEACRLGIPEHLPFIEKPYTVQRLAAAVEQACKGALA